MMKKKKKTKPGSTLQTQDHNSVKFYYGGGSGGIDKTGTWGIVGVPYLDPASAFRRTSFVHTGFFLPESLWGSSLGTEIFGLCPIPTTLF